MRDWIRANRGFVVFLLLLGILRTAVADWNPIPSGSMRPTLLEGDVVLVNRLAYDVKIPLTDTILAHLAEPRRGDIVTFFSPQTGTRLIKRVVALPGDTVEMRNDTLLVNGEAAVYSDPEWLSEPVSRGGTAPAIRLTEAAGASRRRVQFLEGVSAMRSFGPITVPQGSYLMLGDNRDASGDSRYFGFVPRHLIIGRAHHILASADIDGHWMPRLARFGLPLR